MCKIRALKITQDIRQNLFCVTRLTAYNYAEITEKKVFMHIKKWFKQKKMIALASEPNYWCIWIDYNSEKLWKCKICCVKCDIARGDLRVLAHCHFPKMGLNEIVFSTKIFFEIDSEHFGLFQKSHKDFWILDVGSYEV